MKFISGLKNHFPGEAQLTLSSTSVPKTFFVALENMALIYRADLFNDSDFADHFNTYARYNMRPDYVMRSREMFRWAVLNNRLDYVRRMLEWSGMGYCDDGLDWLVGYNLSYEMANLLMRHQYYGHHFANLRYNGTYYNYVPMSLHEPFSPRRGRLPMEYFAGAGYLPPAPPRSMSPVFPPPRYGTNPSSRRSTIRAPPAFEHAATVAPAGMPRPAGSWNPPPHGFHSTGAGSPRSPPGHVMRH